MKQSEALLLLAKAATFDNRRNLDDATATSWAQALDGINLLDAGQAVINHYSRTRDFIMPADIRDGVQTIRNARIHAALGGTEPMPPEELIDDVKAYNNWRRGFNKALGDGHDIHQAETAAAAAAGIPPIHRPAINYRLPMNPRQLTA